MSIYSFHLRLSLPCSRFSSGSPNEWWIHGIIIYIHIREMKLIEFRIFDRNSKNSHNVRFWISRSNGHITRLVTSKCNNNEENDNIEPLQWRIYLLPPFDNHVQNKTSFFFQASLFSNTWPERSGYIVNHKYFVQWVSVCRINVIWTLPIFVADNSQK